MTLRALALGLSLALAALAAPRANELAPDESQAREAMNALHRLGPDARQMRFEGESAARVWPIYATVGQTTSRARLHLAYTSAVSVMPEASSLDVTLNDAPVVHAPIAAGGDTAVIDVELPKGLLRPGYNALKIAATQRHRVDCSLEATYELWTQLDLATSGLTFPGQADPSPRALEDLPAISPGPSGAVVIRAVAPANASPADLDRVMLGAQLVAIRGGFARPEVEFAERVDNRPGLYLVVGKADALARAGLGPFLTVGAGVSLSGGDVPGRTVVVAAGGSDDEVDKALRAIAPAGWEQARHATVPAERALANQGGFRAAGDSRISLHDLGVDSEDFSGRLYRAGFDLVLPPDFFPADYDKMSLLVDASYAGRLGYSSQILVRVNDKEAGSLPLRAPRGDTLSARPIPISLSAFRPGFNHVVIEAQTPNDQDAACAVDQTLKAETRFSLFDRSELVIPRIARIARLPDLAVTTASGFPYERSDAAHLYVAAHNPKTLGAAATLLARTAVAARRPLHMALTTDVSQLARGSAILIGSPTEGVSALAARFEIDLKGMREAWARPPADKDGDAAKVSAGGDENFEQWANEAQPIHPTLDWPARLHAIYDRYINVHFRDFAALRKGDALFSPPPAATLLLAQAAAPAGGGAWTIMLAPDDDALVRGVRSLVATNVWNRVEGRAAALDPKTGAVKTTPTGSPYFIATATLSPANFRLIAAGWLSNDADVYTGLALLAALALGAASYATVRRYGARQ